MQRFLVPSPISCSHFHYESQFMTHNGSFNMSRDRVWKNVLKRSENFQNCTKISYKFSKFFNFSGLSKIFGAFLEQKIFKSFKIFELLWPKSFVGPKSTTFLNLKTFCSRKKIHKNFQTRKFKTWPNLLKIFLNNNEKL